MNRRYALTIGAAVVTGLMFAVAAHATIVSGLAGRWIFNEGSGIVANDSSGLGNNGTLVGSSSFITNDAQKGNVLNIYGVSGEVDFPVTSTLQPATGTVSVWVHPATKETADIVRMDTDGLIACNRIETFYVYGLRILSNGGVSAILANDDPKTCANAPQTVATTKSGLVRANAWTHLAMRWDGTTLSVFVNGKSVKTLQYTPDATGLSYKGNNPLKVGAAIWTFSDGYLEYSGSLSDLRVYSRALTDTEIYNVANGQ